MLQPPALGAEYRITHMKLTQLRERKRKREREREGERERGKKGVNPRTIYCHI